MGAPVYVYGATGFGKTSLIHHVLDGGDALWLSANDDDWDLSAIERDVTCTNVVIDDLQFLSDDRIDTLLELADRTDVWLVLIGRMPTPKWLMPLMAHRSIVIISEEDLVLSAKEAEKLAQSAGFALNETTLARLIKLTQGNAYITTVCLTLLQNGQDFGPDFDDRVHELFAQHLESHVIEHWSVDLQEFLMQVSVVDSFTLPLAAIIARDDHAATLLEEAMQVGNFIHKKGEVYTIRPELLAALRRRARKVYGLQGYRQFLNNAGLYYEKQGQIPRALEIYEAAGNTQNIRSLLVKNSRRHTGSGFYYELRRYYFALPQEDVQSSPFLMSAMSLLYSVLMNPEMSEYWYDQLKQRASGTRGAERQEYYSRLLFLDISLPHRGSGRMKDMILHAATLIRDQNLKLPDLSLTNNQPSAMNGGMDFCAWSKQDELLARTIGKTVEKVLGPTGRGLVHLALGESFFEKGGRDYEALQHLVHASAAIEGGGKIENLFVSIGIQARLCLVKGEVESAIQLLESFEKRVRAERATRLLPNVRTLRCLIALCANDEDLVERWLAEAPDENAEFCTLERYRYLCKVRCYLAKGEHNSALRLLGMLRTYGEANGRTYVLMEIDILSAIALHRLGMDWKPSLLRAMETAEDHCFVRILSSEGAAVLPLLKEVRRDFEAQGKKKAAWLAVVLDETEQVGTRYPCYLGSNVSASRSSFSDQALHVLRRQAEGWSAKQIAQEMDISERTVKYHASENYKKLNAKGKTDAVQKARSLNLL